MSKGVNVNVTERTLCTRSVIGGGIKYFCPLQHQQPRAQEIVVISLSLWK